jgi:hypothetical protein
LVPPDEVDVEEEDEDPPEFLKKVRTVCEI